MKSKLMAAAFVFATNADAQGPPPFELDGPGSASQRVNIVPSAEQDDGTHQIEVFPAPLGGEQMRGQSGAGTGHGRLWTIPGSVAYVIFPGQSGEQISAPLPNDAGTRSFLVFEDPSTGNGPHAPYLFAGEHYFDAQCPTATCGYLDGGLKSEAESSFDHAGGSVAARVEADTPDYGRRYYAAAPGGGDIYNHRIEANASAQIEDWVYVTGPGATATLAISATLAATIDTPLAPVTAEDWTTPVYGDIRNFDPCTDQTSLRTSCYGRAVPGATSSACRWTLQPGSSFRTGNGCRRSPTRRLSTPNASRICIGPTRKASRIAPTTSPRSRRTASARPCRRCRFSSTFRRTRGRAFR